MLFCAGENFLSLKLTHFHGLHGLVGTMTRTVGTECLSHQPKAHLEGFRPPSRFAAEASSGALSLSCVAVVTPYGEACSNREPLTRVGEFNIGKLIKMIINLLSNLY